MTNSIKILFITQTFFPKHKGGTEIYLQNLCKSLQSKNIALEVVCTDYETDGNEYEFMYDSVRVSIIPTYKSLNTEIAKIIHHGSFNLVHVHSFGGRISNSFLQFLQQQHIPIFFTPHLVENFCLNGGTLKYRNKYVCNGFVNVVKCQTCISSIQKGLPIVFKYQFSQFIIQNLIPLKVRSQFLSGFHFLAKNMKEKIFLLKSNNVNVIGLSQWYVEILELNGLKNISFIPYGISKSFNNLNKSISSTSTGFRWIFIGRLSKEKGIDELIEIFQKYSFKGDSLFLCLFINEQLNCFEESILKKINQNSDIILYQNCSTDDISLLLKQSDCLVIPSKVCEMGPLVLYEAKACGIPVLVSENIRENVKSLEVGLKFNYDRVNDFMDKFNIMRKSSKDLFKGLSSFSPNSLEEVGRLHLKAYLRK